MEFTIEFYETDTGRCPVREFLDELKASNPDDFAAVLAGLAKLRSRVYHRPPLSKSIGDDLFELRHLGKLNTRVLYFFIKGQRIILVHGIRKKTRVLLARDRQVALERKSDWLTRNLT
ncbi:MAG: type II toxin-antitoxin system RelE/ParE family toxin [Deltaproteobacteria bacterium]|nr:type II toxin-antitoxin system RelE/ParE family toxin [Deltaproteobacteria bacterium]MBW2002679.1 type II toxin-antitoxin system RelE/ParE family toxin [Deltaproteobacteria bacterium]